MGHAPFLGADRHHRRGLRGVLETRQMGPGAPGSAHRVRGMDGQQGGCLSVVVLLVVIGGIGSLVEEEDATDGPASRSIEPGSWAPGAHRERDSASSQRHDSVLLVSCWLQTW